MRDKTFNYIIQSLCSVLIAYTMPRNKLNIPCLLHKDTIKHTDKYKSTRGNFKCFEFFTVPFVKLCTYNVITV